jgi:hypothetical protein
MQACLFAFTHVGPVVRADLDLALNSISATDSLSAQHGYGPGMSRERSAEPARLLDGVDIACTMVKIYYPVVPDQDCAGHLADWQGGCQLSVICRFL